MLISFACVGHYSASARALMKVKACTCKLTSKRAQHARGKQLAGPEVGDGARALVNVIFTMSCKLMLGGNFECPGGLSWPEVQMPRSACVNCALCCCALKGHTAVNFDLFVCCLVKRAPF